MQNLDTGLTIDEKIVTQAPLEHCFPICPVAGAEANT
jgi:hypothetical protein